MPTEADQAVSLSVLFERFFAPEHDSVAGSRYAQKFRTALKWFRLFLEREPTIGDIDVGTLDGFFRFCLKEGQSIATVRTYRARLSLLQRYAAEHGMVSDLIQLPSVTGQKKTRQAKRGLPRIGTVRHFYEFTFLPSLLDRGTSPAVLQSYRAALTWLHRWRDGAVAMNSLDAADVATFADWLGRSVNPTTTARYSGHLRAILQAAGRIVRLAAVDVPDLVVVEVVDV